jgi:hypothetical protein
MFHGHGAGDEAAEKTRLRRFCTRVAKAVHKAIGSYRAPLVIAAAEPVAGTFRAVYNNADEIAGVVDGNPEHRSAEELHKAALALVADRFDEQLRTAWGRCCHLAARGYATSEPEAILTRAFQGQVEALFVAPGAHAWGRFDPETGAMTTRDEPAAGDDDLLNLAAVQTRLSGGTVYPLPADAAGSAGDMTAALRFVPEPGA